MEHKIGEIITLPDGRKAKVIESTDSCSGCLYNTNDAPCRELRNKEMLGECVVTDRTDGRNIIYEEIKEE